MQKVKTLSGQARWPGQAGMSMVQVLIAAAAVAGLGVVVTSMMTNLNKTQANVRLSNIATDLESRFRTATLSSRALYNSRTATANTATLARCFTIGCPLNSAVAFELRDTANAVLVPSAQPAFVNDAGALCTQSASNLTCQWQVRATYTPRCSGACTIPASYELSLSIAWAKPPGSSSNFVMRPKEIRTSVAKEMFAAPPSTSQCAPSQVITGINSDGTPNCRPVSAPDLGPEIVKSIGQCPANQVLTGIDLATGTPTCKTVVPYVAACTGWLFYGYDTCTCPGGMFMMAHDLWPRGDSTFNAQCVCCSVGTYLQ